MHYFSIHNLNNEHLSFFIIQKNHKNDKYGQLTIKYYNNFIHNHTLNCFESQMLSFMATNKSLFTKHLASWNA